MIDVHWIGTKHLILPGILEGSYIGLLALLASLVLDLKDWEVENLSIRMQQISATADTDTENKGVR